MTVDLPAVAILGTGSMGGAILGGLLSPDVRVEGGIRVTTRTEAKAGPLRRPGVTALATETDPEANRAAVAGARLVVVAVKPAGVPDLLGEVAAALEPGAVVVSVAAGVRIATMEELVPGAVLRAMPNTPALVRRGVTGLAAGPRATEEDLGLARRVFETVGSVLVVPEDRIDAVSAVSGSGPAYVFYLIEELTRTAVRLGFSATEAELLVERTFVGACALLDATGAAPRELRRQVTSPKGTTERAIAELERADLAGLFDRATAAAIARSRELAEG